jgi:branched-chain amino acid transport system substrate-binding protein
MSKKTIVVFVLVVAVIAAALWLFNDRQQNLIRIGAALPLTGKGAIYGQSAHRGIQLAVDEINAAGGINGVKIKIVEEDTRMEASAATNAVSKLGRIDKIPVIIGPMTSQEVSASIKIADENKIVLVSPSATAHTLTGTSRYFFRTVVSDIYDGTAMAQFAYNTKLYRKVGILAVQSAGPVGVCEAFQKEFQRLGGNIAQKETGQESSTDFRSQLTRLRDANVDAIFFAGFATETATILKQAVELGVKAQLLTHQLAEDPKVRELAGSAADGLIFSTPKLDPSSGDREVITFYEAFRARYKEDPQNFASNAYDAVKVIAEAAAKNGYSAEGIRKGLADIKDYHGASGQLTFDEKGDVIQTMRVMQISGGKIVPADVRQK